MSEDIPPLTPPGEDIGELLRERMIRAVSPIEPAPGTLEKLRVAVPYRRKRRYAAMATTAVTVVAVGTAMGLISRNGSPDGSQASTSSGSVIGTTTAGRMPGADIGGSGQSPGHTPAGSHYPIPAYPVTPTVPMTPQGTKNGEIPVSPPLMISGTSVSVPSCQNSSMSQVSMTAGPVIGGVSYEIVTATAQETCVIVGPPYLATIDGSGVLAQVPVFREDGVAASALAPVSGWGRQMLLTPGDKYQFQFAWVPTVCPPSSLVPVTSVLPPPSGSPTTDGGTPPITDTPTSGGTPSGTWTSPSNPVTTTTLVLPPAAPYTVGYAVSGKGSVSTAAFSAPCGAVVYTTDIFPFGEYADPHLGTVIAPLVSPSS